MPQDAKNLIWIDLEMTGLDTLNDTIIEIATVVTDKSLTILAEGPVFAISTSKNILAKMDRWNQKTHGESGLLDRIDTEGVNLMYAERETLKFIRKFVPAKQSPMAGNSVCQDRRFLHRQMPDLERYFHYRNFDVSTLKELAIRMRPDLLQGFQKREMHTALADTIESIEEMRYYCEHFLKL